MVFAREATAAGVIEPIRSGRTVAIDQFGHRYGDASLIQLLDTVTLVDRPDVDPPVETLFWRRVSLVFTWFGIGGMLVTRGGGLTRCTRSLTQSTRRNSAILAATRFGTAM